MWVRTYSHTYIHSYTCKFARPPYNSNGDYLSNSIIYLATVMAAAAAAGLERPSLLSHNEAVFNILSANISYNSFIQSNEVECADCVFSATYVAFWAIIDVNSPGVSRGCLGLCCLGRSRLLRWGNMLAEDTTLTSARRLARGIDLVGLRKFVKKWNFKLII